MKTHTDVTIWLEGEPEFDVRVTEGSAWAWVAGCITIHTIEGTTGVADLEVLAKWFYAGLEAVNQVRTEWCNRPLPGLEVTGS